VGLGSRNVGVHHVHFDAIGSVDTSVELRVVEASAFGTTLSLGHVALVLSLKTGNKRKPLIRGVMKLGAALKTVALAFAVSMLTCLGKRRNARKTIRRGGLSVRRAALAVPALPHGVVVASRSRARAFLGLAIGVAPRDKVKVHLTIDVLLRESRVQSTRGEL
jgi:hypothetical protein